jgi:AraC family transcriptional regulator
MHEFPAVARLEWPDARLVHFASHGQPASAASDRDLAITDPSSISLALFGAVEAHIETAGKRSDRRIVPGSVTLCGPEPIRWIGASSGSEVEFIEIGASEAVRRDVAGELGVARHFELDDDHGWTDPVVFAIASRFRSAARATAILDDIERDLLLRRLYGRVFAMRFGGRLPPRAGGLDPGRLDRVTEFVEAHLDANLTVGRLAAVAALSPFHFIRAFRLSTGLTPHRYVRGRRLEQARSLIASGALIRDVAARVGYENLGHFRRAYRAHFGSDYASGRRSLGRTGCSD